MTVCTSLYQNRDIEGVRIGDPIRCSRRGEHAGTEGEGEGETRDDDLHQARTSYGLTRWPNRSAVPVLILAEPDDTLHALRHTLVTSRAAILSAVFGDRDLAQSHLDRLDRMLDEVDRLALEASL